MAVNHFNQGFNRGRGNKGNNRGRGNGRGGNSSQFHNNQLSGGGQFHNSIGQVSDNQFTPFPQSKSSSSSQSQGQRVACQICASESITIGNGQELPVTHIGNRFAYGEGPLQRAE
ncbi:hypothetical protein CMV_027053 [Castanea mollissima]|uniref:Uncharacterized protein n=1 Tax=Castanea mollissima TaxID=60419 RepID=A0A8J4Q728_9ROSI|nr:hypothetical protein CMV_027053 [Castanea mollissima]